MPDVISEIGTIGYVHAVSNIMTGKSNNKYFYGQLQTDTDEYVRIVGYSTKKHSQLQQCASEKLPIQICANPELDQKRSGSLVIHVGDKTGVFKVEKSAITYDYKEFETVEAVTVSWIVRYFML